MRQRLIDFARSVWDVLVTPMTPGQRQTSLFLVPLAIALLVEGSPSGGDGVAADAAGSPMPLESSNITEPPATSGPERSATLEVPDVQLEPPLPTPSVRTRSTAPVSAAALPSVVALVRSDGGKPGRTDAAFASFFLGNRAVRVTTLPVEGEPRRRCAHVLAAGSLVIASRGLAPELSECLLAGGATIVSYDDLAPAGVVSTRHCHRPRRPRAESAAHRGQRSTRTALRITTPVAQALAIQVLSRSALVTKLCQCRRSM